MFFLGHANEREGHAYLHLPGPDLRDDELAALFNGIACREQVFWMTTAASGRFLPALSAKGRVVITATTGDQENNETEFPQALAEVSLLASKELDADKDGKVSVWELFVRTSQAATARFEADGRAPPSTPCSTIMPTSEAPNGPIPCKKKPRAANPRMAIWRRRRSSLFNSRRTPDSDASKVRRVLPWPHPRPELRNEDGKMMSQVSRSRLKEAPLGRVQRFVGLKKGRGKSEKSVPTANLLHEYIDPLLLANLEDLELIARTVVEGFLHGLHRSPYVGFSVEFASHREYLPGDDLRHLNWKLYARNDKLYIKQYDAETNLDCHLVVDVSASMETKSARHLQAAVCDDAGRGGGAPGLDPARRRRNHALRRSGARPCQTASQGQPARRDPGDDGAVPRADAGRRRPVCCTKSPSSCPGAGSSSWSATSSSRPRKCSRAWTISAFTGTTSWSFTCSTRVEHRLAVWKARCGSATWKPAKS